MAGRFCDYFNNAIIDKLLRGGNNLYAASWYFALLNSSPEPFSVTGGFMNYPNTIEVSYTGYARQLVNSSTTAWRRTDGDNTTADSTGSSGYTSVGTRIYFPLCTTSTQLVTHVALLDNNIVDTINQAYAYWQLDTPIQLLNAAPGFYPTIPDEALKLKFS